MKYALTLKNLEITAADQDMLEEKVQRLKKHLRPPFQVRIVLRGDTHHRQGQVITCVLYVSQSGQVLYAERSRQSVQTALDETVEALTSEIRKHRDKRQTRR